MKKLFLFLLLPSLAGAAGNYRYLSGTTAGQSDLQEIVTSTITASSVTVQNITINGTCTGSGCGTGSGGGVTVPSSFTWSQVDVSTIVASSGTFSEQLNVYKLPSTIVHSTGIFNVDSTIDPSDLLNPSSDEWNEANLTSTVWESSITGTNTQMVANYCRLVNVSSTVNVLANAVCGYFWARDNPASNGNLTGVEGRVTAQGNAPAYYSGNFLTQWISSPGKEGTNSNIWGAVFQVYVASMDYTGISTGTAVTILLANKVGSGAPGKSWNIYGADQDPSWLAGSLAIGQAGSYSAFTVQATTVNATGNYVMLLGTGPVTSGMTADEVMVYLSTTGVFWVRDKIVASTGTFTKVSVSTLAFDTAAGSSLVVSTVSANMTQSYRMAFSTLTPVYTNEWPVIEPWDFNFYKIAGTSSTVTPGHMAVYSSTYGTLIDGGAIPTGSTGGGVVVPSTFVWSNITVSTITASSATIGNVSVASLTVAGALNIRGSTDWPLFVPESDSNYYRIAGSSATVAAGNYAMFSSTNGALIDGGIPAGTGSPAGPAWSVQVSSGGVLGGFSNLTNNGSTITINGLYTMTQTNISSISASGVGFDYSSSTMSLMQLTVSTAAASSATITNLSVSSLIVNGVAYSPGGSGTITLSSTTCPPSNEWCYSVAGSTWAETLSSTMTPHGTNDIIRITISGVASSDNGAFYQTLYRDGINILHSTTGFGFMQTPSAPLNFTHVFYDKPNTTSAVVYSFRGRDNGSGTYNAGVNGNLWMVVEDIWQN